MRARRKHVEVEARQVGTGNMQFIEEWCGGAIKGTKLPAKERVIEIQRDGEEIRAGVGDWVIKEAPGLFRTCAGSLFWGEYEETGR